MMEHHDRPPILRKKRLLQIALIVMIPVFFGGLLLRCLSACVRLQQAQREAQNVSAVIYDVYGDDEYDVYIRYRYDGELYDIRYKSGTSDKSWKNREGETISVRINPRRPGELIETMEINARNTVFALGFFNLWVLIPAMETRKKWTEVYGYDRIFIQRDLKDCVRRHTLWKWGLMTGAEMIAVRLLFGEAITIWAVPLGAVLILLGTMGMRHYLADLKKNQQGRVCHP